MEGVTEELILKANFSLRLANVSAKVFDDVLASSFDSSCSQEVTFHPHIPLGFCTFFLLFFNFLLMKINGN